MHTNWTVNKTKKNNNAYKDINKLQNKWSTGTKTLNPEEHPEVDSIMPQIGTESDLKKQSVS